MTKNKKKIDLKRFKSILPYILVATGTLALVFVGSIDKQNSDVNLSLDAFAASNYRINSNGSFVTIQVLLSNYNPTVTLYFN